MHDAPAAREIPAAELRGVTKRFGPARVLEHLDLAARPGEFLTLLGPSGCGKTTALRLLGGFETPDAGRVFLAGRDVTDLPPFRREVHQVFQSYALFPHLSVEGNIAFGLRMKRLPAAEIARRVAAVVELTALGPLTARRPAQLSGGQRQRVALARALVNEPPVLLLDEPLSALDARLRAELRGELRALQRRLGSTFIFVTHDQEEALTLSDRVAVMNAGRVVQIGGVEDIYHRPANRFVAEFVGEANLIEARFFGRESDTMIWVEIGEIGTVGRGLPLQVKRPEETAAAPTLAISRVTLLIRPECIHLRTEAPFRESNSLYLRVEDRTFQGAATVLTLRMANDEIMNVPPLRALIRSGHGVGPPVGATLAAHVAPEDIKILSN